MEWSLATTAGQTWLKASDITFTGQGTVLPRLTVSFHVEKYHAESRVKVAQMSGQLKQNNELLAIAQPFLGPQEVYNSLLVTFEFPLSPEAIATINALTGQPTLSLSVVVHGSTLVLPGPGQQHFASDLEPGQWAEVEVTDTTLSLNIAVSDWYSRVLEPIGTYRYVIYGVALPKVQEAGPIASAVKLLAQAEQAYAHGDDVSVFTHCRGAWDALPGAKQTIFDGIVSDPQKRQALDELGGRAGDYLHRGRHIVASGPQAGEFAIDHRDAELALNLTKLLIGYIAKIS